MKKLAFILVATILLGSLSCTKSSTDDPPTIPNYTIKYSVVSVDSVNMDTIKCMDIDGSYIYVIEENHFELSFVQPSTNYHGDMYISGTVVDGSCSYSLIVEAEDGTIVDIKENTTSSTLSTSFKWWASFSHIED
ncbi:MAG: hypothetical protein QM503_11425 [Bacteroidota bacterium]